MIKLTQKAWNNVIIISMLVLIVMFNSTSNFLNGESSSSQVSNLLPQSAEISSMDFGEYKIERIGQGWRVQHTAATEAQIQTLIDAWFSAKLLPLSESISLADARRSVVVRVRLLGQPQPLTFEVFELPSQVVINNGMQLLQLDKQSFDALILPGVPHA